MQSIFAIFWALFALHLSSAPCARAGRSSHRACRALRRLPQRAASLLGSRMGVELVAGKMRVDWNMRTSVPGVHAVGDAGSDQPTHVLHALHTDKLCAIHRYSRFPRMVNPVAGASRRQDG